MTRHTPGLTHDSLTDVPFMESIRNPKAEAAARHCLSLTVDVTLAFFDQYLRGKDHGLLDRVRESGSEITVRHYSPGSA
jgi:hypothetical protein